MNATNEALAGFNLTLNANPTIVALKETVTFSGKATLLSLGVPGTRIEVVASKLNLTPQTHRLSTMVLNPWGDWEVSTAFHEPGVYEATARMYPLLPFPVLAESSPVEFVVSGQPIEADLVAFRVERIM